MALITTNYFNLKIQMKIIHVFRKILIDGMLATFITNALKSLLADAQTGHP